MSDPGHYRGELDTYVVGDLCAATGGLGCLPFWAYLQGTWNRRLPCKRSYTSDEVSAFINKFLKSADSDKLTSHSFKHTTLSWASSYGIDEPARTLRGHHELQGARSMAVYSKDMLTRPLQLYCSNLKNIRGDHFRPDESRTSRMLDLMKIQQGETAGKDLDAALKPVAADKGHRLETDDEVAPTTPLDEEMTLHLSRHTGMISSKVQSSGISNHTLRTSVQLWMAEPFLTD